jgi:hypothetical protein
MAPQLITMLTYKDETVKSCFEVFAQCADLSASFWGFKDVGLPKPDMKRLVERMKEKGKATFLEVVSLTERECLDGAQLALDCGFDYLMGTLFYDSVFKLVQGKHTKFFPFAGKVSGHPSILEGSIPEIVAEGQRMEQLGVAGFDLLAYRYTGDAEMLAEAFVKGLRVPVVLAGSVDSFPRLDVMKRVNPWAFTIGSAFFDRKFVPGGTFREQMARVLDYLRK